jgi:DNA-binding transcriptional ArsR family regulator
MEIDLDIAAVAAVIGNPTRAAFLSALIDVDALPAGELARLRGVSPQTASEHLARLADLGLIRAERSGRHRYFRLGSPLVAAAIEALSLIAPVSPPLHEAKHGSALSAARTCYDHLAGSLGVAVAGSLEEQQWIASADDGFALTTKGERGLSDLGVDVASLREQRRPLTRPCLDWSQRRYHLAGAVGSALASRLFELRWVERLPGGRAVRVTDAGRRGFDDRFGLSL